MAHVFLRSPGNETHLKQRSRLLTASLDIYLLATNGGVGGKWGYSSYRTAFVEGIAFQLLPFNMTGEVHNAIQQVSTCMCVYGCRVAACSFKLTPLCCGTITHHAAQLIAAKRRRGNCLSVTISDSLDCMSVGRFDGALAQRQNGWLDG